MTTIAGAALSALVLAGLLLVPSGAARAGPPEPRELPGLREAPDIPVGSIFLRRALPGHPLPPAVEREFPGPDAPGLEGRPPPGGGGCDKDVDLDPFGVIRGVVNVTALDTGICTNADLDTIVVSDNDGLVDAYVVQAGGQEMAWTQTRVTDPANPVIVGQFFWSNANNGRRNTGTYTPDVKTFRQDGSDYIVMGLERTKITGFCGVIIVNVTDPAMPNIESQFNGADWCDVHNVFVENDELTGDGKYIYVTADGTNDLRVLDISSVHIHADHEYDPDVIDCTECVASPTEIGSYAAPTANNDNYVHDVTVLYHSALVVVENSVVVDDGRRVYLSYWDSGLIILKAAEVTLVTNAVPVVGPVLVDGTLDVTNVIDPPGFLTHHAWASADGSLVFIQDEFMDSAGDEPVQMWDVTTVTNVPPSPPTYVDGLVLGTDVPVNPAHNLEIRYDNLVPERLYVAWYKQGLQAWDFDGSGFSGAGNSPRTAAVYHQAQTEAADGAYSGAWGVRLLEIGGLLFIFQSDRNFGLIVDCEDCTAVTGTVTDKSTNPIQGASVVADTGQSATTDASGDYTLNDVPTGTRTVTASATGYVTQQNTNVVVDLGVTTANIDFALKSAVGGTTGTINGTVTDSITGGVPISGALVEADTGQSDTTDGKGFYELTNVPDSNLTVTASKTGYVTEQLPATVTAGQTTTVDFALDAEATGGGTGTIKGTVRDADRTRLSGVSVMTDNTEGSVTTNRRGMYSIKNVPVGDVTVTAEADGFVIEQITVEVLNGQTTAGVDFALVPQ